MKLKAYRDLRNWLYWYRAEVIEGVVILVLLVSVASLVVWIRGVTG